MYVYICIYICNICVYVIDCMKNKETNLFQIIYCTFLGSSGNNILFIYIFALNNISKSSQ